MHSLIARLAAAGMLHPSLILRGLEKENLRVAAAGGLSALPHSQLFGQKQTHASITTDFAEAQMEVVSGVHNSVRGLCAEFHSLYQFIYARLADELLWPYSMPCMTEPDEIRPAYYGENNAAKMKQIYRQGLIHRYGKAMQIICGIHYNFSLDRKVFAYLKQQDNSPLPIEDYISKRYMGLIRNYFRSYSLLPYLFGATPLIMKSSLPSAIPEGLLSFDKQTFYAPYATSLRMSRIGYQNNAQSGLKICHNTVTAYGRSLLAATQIPYAPFVELGIKGAKGQYQQLNGNILQIENEYYSPIRPKRIVNPGERPAMALLSRGIEYIEVRVSDLNPLLPLGISPEQLKFMDVFLLMCLLNDSPEFIDDELARHRHNFNTIAMQGRKPNITLQDSTGPRQFIDWAECLFKQMLPIAAALDATDNQGYEAAVLLQQQKLSQVQLLPAQQIMQDLENSGHDLTTLMLAQARRHREGFLQPLAPETNAKLAQQVQDSIAEWQKLEQELGANFEAYLTQYFSQGVISDPHRLCY